MPDVPSFMPFLFSQIETWREVARFVIDQSNYSFCLVLCNNKADAYDNRPLSVIWFYFFYLPQTTKRWFGVTKWPSSACYFTDVSGLITRIHIIETKRTIKVHHCSIFVTSGITGFTITPQIWRKWKFAVCPVEIGAALLWPYSTNMHRFKLVIDQKLTWNNAAFSYKLFDWY